MQPIAKLALIALFVLLPSGLAMSGPLTDFFQRALQACRSGKSLAYQQDLPFYEAREDGVIAVRTRQEIVLRERGGGDLYRYLKDAFGESMVARDETGTIYFDVQKILGHPLEPFRDLIVEGLKSPYPQRGVGEYLKRGSEILNWVENGSAEQTWLFENFGEHWSANLSAKDYQPFLDAPHLWQKEFIYSSQSTVEGVSRHPRLIFSSKDGRLDVAFTLDWAIVDRIAELRNPPTDVGGFVQINGEYAERIIKQLRPKDFIEIETASAHFFRDAKGQLRFRLRTTADGKEEASCRAACHYLAPGAINGRG